MDDATFSSLLTRARSGESDATTRLLRTFEPEVRIMVRARLPKALRSRFDSMDFVQAVWQSVFAGDGLEGEFSEIDRFRGYLAGVAKHKVYEEYRRRTRTRKFDLGREEPLYVRKGDREAVRDLPAVGPTASQVVQADEVMERLVAGRTPLEVRIVRMRQEGRTFEEIAASTGLSDRSVRRTIEAARRRVPGA